MSRIIDTYLIFFVGGSVVLWSHQPVLEVTPGGALEPCSAGDQALPSMCSALEPAPGPPDRHTLMSKWADLLVQAVPQLFCAAVANVLIREYLWNQELQQEEISENGL